MCCGSTLTPVFLLIPRVPQPPPLISSPSGCARGLNGWCHGSAWDDVPCRGSRGCPCCVCSFRSKRKLEPRDRPVDPVLVPADTDGVLPGFYISGYDNLFCSFWTQNQIIGDFRMTLDNRDSRCCCTVFLSANRGQQSVRLGMRTTTAAVWVHSGLAVLPGFHGALCVYSPVF